ncbi:efflux RND transporter permease subunit [Sulfurovum sp. NBC37-1]|uniref:efflux RND transporter permease subunit n=1 Tax=Sulfurovum sp. (strain NBC37-1) TaxID=387093 RepID=UPI0001587D82|nr:multidrug efflux RND transporter permease subunit [Sulfurovum sp. NBC37-1]BAF73192.1 multidrug efflux transporter, RND superfamily [Sulfurovum sp. NBC37-1]
MFSVFFIKRPVVAMVISIFIVIVGLIALNILPVAQFPQIVPPTVQVSANYPGGSAEVVEKTVTAPIEEQLNGTEGMIYMESSSSSDGTSKIKVYFDLSRNLDLATVDVQNRVALAMPTLPVEVTQKGVSTKKLSSSMLQIISVQSSNPQHDALYLSNFASLNIVDELKRIDGVSDVVNFGERRYAMRVWLNPDKLSALGVTLKEITQAIKEQNLQVSLGTIGDTALSAQTKYQYTLVAKTRLNSAKEFKQIIIRENEDGSKIYLRDIARVELGSESYISSARLNGKPSAQLGIFQLPDANALDVAQRVKAKLASLQKRFPKEIKLAATYDTTKFVEVSIDEVVKTLFEALLLVLLVVYLFLQSFRATIIPAVAIPVSLIGTFAVLFIAGFSINTLTLFGLILAIGIVVDDAILVVENVEANLEKHPGISVKEATVTAMKEIFAPIVSTTLVLLAVFVPVTFIPGISGALYQQFAMTISFSVLISAVVALTLSPALAAMILRPHEGEKNFFFRAFNNALESLKNVYEKILKVLIRGWVVVLLLYLLLVGATYAMFKVLPTGFLPDEDQGTLIASVAMQPGTVLKNLETTTQKMVKMIKEVKGVSDVVSINGYNTITGVSDSSNATFYIILDDWKDRTTKETSVPYLISELTKMVNKEVSEANTRFFGAPSIPGISAIGGFEFKLQNRSAMPMKQFEKEAHAFIQRLNADKRIKIAYTMFNADYPQLYVDIDRDKVFSLGLKLNDVFAVLQTYLGSYYVNDFNKFGKTYRVFLQADPRYRTNIHDITTFFVKNNKGEMIPLSTIVKIQNRVGPNVITRFNGYQSIGVNGVHNVREGYSSSDAIAAIEELAAAYLPAGIGYEYSGITLQEKEAGNAALYIFMLSLLMVFLFLSAQYESWLTPLMVMLPIPVVMFGALGANMMAGLLNDIYAQIGLVLLIGMSSKNAILIVEFAKELHAAGKDIVSSAIEASILRLRAILMTVFAFLLGILPLVFASGAGAASRQSLGTAVFGGMLMSTLLTFLLTPVLFVVLQRMKERFSKEKK